MSRTVIIRLVDDAAGKETTLKFSADTVEHHGLAPVIQALNKASEALDREVGVPVKANRFPFEPQKT